MEALPVEEEVGIVVDEATEMAEVMVESLGQRTVAFLRAEVPLAEDGGLVACAFEVLSLLLISEPTRPERNSFAVFCLIKKI